MSVPETVPPALVRRRRLQLVLIALLFFGPLGLAFWLYYGGARFMPDRHVNHGELIAPARPLPGARLPTPSGTPTAAGFLRGKWSLLYLTGTHCDDACRARLADLAKVRFAMDRERDRVQRVLLGEAGCCGTAEVGAPAPDLVTAWLEGGEAERLLATFPAAGVPLADARRVYIVDPLGNLMMSYPADADAKGIMKDLEKLLRLSHIG